MKKNPLAIVVSCFSWLLFLAAPVLAVDDYGIFELEQGLGNANAVDDGNDDWETLHNGLPNGSNVFSGIITDPDGESIFGGGNKDIHDVSTWSWVDSSVPDKSDLLHAAAAAYNYNDDLVIYYTADRYANSGDTFMGFWFFQDEVEKLPGGDFKGEHQPGDVLVLVNFPQSANAEPLVQALVWDPPYDPLTEYPGDGKGCSKKIGPNPLVGECAATNLRLLSNNSGADAAVCVPGGDQDVCANTNNKDKYAPWSYTPKAGNDGYFPFETFFEGGINISELLPNAECFATFMAETRASSSFTAQLKDFVIGDFPLCGIEVGKFCYANTPNVGATPTDTTYTYDVAGCLENDGFGKVTNLSLVDDPAFDTDTLRFFEVSGPAPTDAACGYNSAVGNIGALYNAIGLEITDPAAYELAAGEKVLWHAQFTDTKNAAKDKVTASVTTLSGSAIPDATDSAICPGAAFIPDLAVSKNCDAGLIPLATNVGSIAAVSIDICGAVSNPGEIRLLDVTVVDDHAGTVKSLASLAEDGGSSSYSGTYLANSATLPSYDFSDTVTAKGYVESNLVENVPGYCSRVVTKTIGSYTGQFNECLVTSNATCDPCVDNDNCP